MTGTTTPKRAKRRIAIPAVIAGGLSSLLLAFSMTPTFSALTAAITNSTNTAGVGAIVMQEFDNATGTGTANCDSSIGGTNNSLASCSVNKYGGSMTMLPGGSSTINISIKNASTSSVAASAFTLTPAACTTKTQADSATGIDLCSQYTVVITSGTKPVYSGTAAGFSSAINLLDATHLNKANIAVGEVVPFTIVITLNGSAVTGSATQNSYQGLKISQPLTWTFQAS